MQTGLYGEEEMNKKLLMLISALAFILMFALIILPVEARLTSVMWLDPNYKGYDDYYGQDVNAYLVGTEAKALVTVYNDVGEKAYVTVRMHIDWEAENRTSTEIDKLIQPGRSYTFEVVIQIPTTVSNLVIHSYTIYISYYKSPGGELITTHSYYKSDFAVYSQDQADAHDYRTQVETWRAAYSPTIYYFFMTSAKAKEFWIKGATEKVLGDKSYEYGDFEEAKTHYELALNYTLESLKHDTETGQSYEESLLGIMDSLRSLFGLQGWSWIIAAIGFFFMGIGVIVYLVRKSKPAAPPATSS
jgi:hypothetical protein